jgi:hypothetical protein
LGFLVAPFSLAFPPTTYTRSSSPPFVLHTPIISSSSPWESKEMHTNIRWDIMTTKAARIFMYVWMNDVETDHGEIYCEFVGWIIWLRTGASGELLWTR